MREPMAGEVWCHAGGNLYQVIQPVIIEVSNPNGEFEWTPGVLYQEFSPGCQCPKRFVRTRGRFLSRFKYHSGDGSD